MSKKQKELIDKCKEITWLEALNKKYDSIYFIPLRKKHDSGYNLLQVIGEIRHKSKDNEYYTIDYCDVIDFESYYEPCNPIRDLHIDCNNGVYHIWSNRQKMIPQHLVSNAIFKMDKLDSLGDKETEEIPLFEGTLEQLNNLSIIGGKEDEHRRNI